MSMAPEGKGGANGGGEGAEIDAVREWENKIIQGECLSILADAPDNFVDLIVTSPPSADGRTNTHGGVPPDEYVEWFMPIAAQLKRVLKPDGTFILNIKEEVVDGERHTYVMELIIEMRKQDWLWTEEYRWCKKNYYPEKGPNRFGDAWEHCLQFNKQKKFRMYQEAVMVPVGDWAKTRLKNLSETDKRRDESKTGSGFGKKMSNWLGRDMVFPNNVLHVEAERVDEGHSAAFPSELPEWFIKLFTKEGDLVLDPFLGSGTTAVAAHKLGRKHLGVELRPVDVDLATTYETAANPTTTRTSTGRTPALLSPRGGDLTLFPVEDTG